MVNTQAVKSKRGRGRPPGDSDTRAAIMAEARREFAEQGYQSTTLRSVGRGAGVDPRLVLHYFGSKQNLFLTCVELPIDSDLVIGQVFSGGREEAPRRAVELVLSVLEDSARRDALLGILRAAVSEPEAAEIIRSLLTERLLSPIARRIGGERPEMRASMMASAVVGLVIVRHVVGIEPLATADRETLVRALTPVAEHYLLGDWVQATPGLRLGSQPPRGS